MCRQQYILFWWMNWCFRCRSFINLSFSLSLFFFTALLLSTQTYHLIFSVSAHNFNPISELKFHKTLCEIVFTPHAYLIYWFFASSFKPTVMMKTLWIYEFPLVFSLFFSFFFGFERCCFFSRDRFRDDGRWVSEWVSVCLCVCVCVRLWWYNFLWTRIFINKPCRSPWTVDIN